MQDSVINIINLQKHFGAVKAVDGISFQVNQGEIFGYLGPNGAGKTTTIRCLMDFIHPTDGDIEVFGKSVKDFGVQARADIGYLSPDVPLYPHLNGKQHVELITSLRGSDVDAEKLAKLFSLDLSIKSKNLSSGNKQKLGLVLALMGKPKLLVLDEPTAALDPILQNIVYQYLVDYSKSGGTVLISSHNLAEVEKICHRVAIIRRGKLMAVEKMEELRKKKIHIINVRFAHEVDPKHFKLENANVEQIAKDSLQIKVQDDLNPILKLISKCQVADMDIDHASLEDVFLSYY